MGKLKITQTRSVIKRIEKQKRTIEAMGLGRTNNTTVMPDNHQTRVMIEIVKHLVKV